MQTVILFGAFLWVMGVFTGLFIGKAIVYRHMVKRIEVLRRVMR